ncbi:Homoserine O-succinyltransferase [Liquorilactobacillus aquaticus DSM 21051]|uniref:Serine O-acetyltransferase n=1 Tax=Liquorilactobacillus aquaticus DSM 21051 TaxID=1423725 RepID=A0A0R2D077_9LACO|nr:homoserine O-succinyltransferase [Liquorilactobacillus aquaticus]KRM96778.1 Homoserine O-succinyltransferase [Liquorilactobacillus aquaticus DSM 21051]
MKKQERVKIGILNLMHNKEESQKQFAKVLTNKNMPVDLTFYYPVTHYEKRSVPERLQQIASPLDLEEVKQQDAFIISGAPIEKLDFREIRYMPEIEKLLDTLEKSLIEQLYVCWGAMAALNYFYGIQKNMMPTKVFGIYPNVIHSESALLQNFHDGFLAPHARYAEMDHQQIAEQEALTILASDMKDRLTLVEAAEESQTFLFSHLEYDKEALLKEYQREIAAYPENEESLVKPEHYFKYPEKMEEPIFSWEDTQRRFYDNWLKKVFISRNKSIVAYER